jgi:hypothetical protein
LQFLDVLYKVRIYLECVLLPYIEYV